jgi:ribonuclease HI
MQHNNHLNHIKKPDGMYLCSDVACYGNPGAYEFRVMDWNKQIRFQSRKFEMGTNNIGEFLGIVSAFEVRKTNGYTCPVFSDSLVAINWVNNKKCRTQGEMDLATQQAIYLAELFLQKNATRGFLFFWNKNKWGEEIPADYGRK